VSRRAVCDAGVVFISVIDKSGTPRLLTQQSKRGSSKIGRDMTEAPDQACKGSTASSGSSNDTSFASWRGA